MQINPKKYSLSPSAERTLGVYVILVVLKTRGGSGGDKLDCAFKHGCDTFVTADIKYHTFLAAKELGMNLIDADHFCTENVITEVLADKLRANFPKADVRVSKLHAQTVKFY